MQVRGFFIPIKVNSLVDFLVITCTYNTQTRTKTTTNPKLTCTQIAQT